MLKYSTTNHEGYREYYAGQCPWVVSGKDGQNVRAAVAIAAAYTTADPISPILCLIAKMSRSNDGT